MTTTIRASRRSPGTTARPRDALVDALVSDAHRLLGHLPEQELGPRGAEAVALLALIAGQDVEPVEGSDGTDGRWRIAQDVAGDRVISTVDPETRHVHKTVHRRQDGFKAHVAVEPDTGIVTDCALRQANGAENHEAVVGLELLAERTRRVGSARRFGLRHWRGPHRVGRCRAYRGHQAASRCAARSRADSPVDDFNVDEAAGQVTCPAGHTVSITTARQRSVRGRVPQLSVAGALHHRQPRPED